MLRSLLVLAVLSVLAATATGQAQAPASAASGATQPLASELSTYITLIGGVLTGVATLLGIPIVRLNQRKTRAEIEKLELESAALRNKTSESPQAPSRPGEGVRIQIDRSPNATVQVLADPRFLAPLLLLLDFVFAWVLLTLAGYFLALFSVGFLRQLALIALALILLVPIAKQAIHVRAVLRPDRSEEELAASVKQGRTIAYLVYFVLFFSSLALSGFLFSSGMRRLGNQEDFMAWGLATWTALLLLAMPFVKRKVDRYIESQLRPPASPPAAER